MSGINEDASNATLYVCVKPFSARLGDELSLQVGDKIEVLADDSEYNDGWFMGQNIASHEVGLYPKLFTQPMRTANPNHTLLRSRSRRVMRPNDVNQNPTAKLNKIANAMQNVNLKSDTDGDTSKDDTRKKPLQKDSPSNSVNRTMNDINKALQELQGASDKSVSDSMSKASQERDVLPSHHNRNVSDISTGDSLNPSEVTSWTPQQVTSYFNTILGFDSDVSGKFTLHKITGAILLELDLSHLKELEIDTFGTRFEISKEIGKLKNVASSKNVTPKYNNKDNEKGTRNNLVEKKAPDALSDISYEDLRSPNVSKTSSPFKMNSTKTNSDEETNNTTYSRNYGQGNFSTKFTSSTPSKNIEVNGTSHQLPNQYPDADISTKDEDPSVLFFRRAHNVSKESKEADNEYNGNNEYDEKPRSRENDNTLTGRPTSSIYEGKTLDRKASSSKNDISFPLASAHRRRSSLFLFESGNNNRLDVPAAKQDYESPKGEHKSKDGLLTSEKRKSRLLSPTGDNIDNFHLTAKSSSSEGENQPNSPIVEDIDNVHSPDKLKSISYRGGTTPKGKDAKDKRVVSESTVSRLKNFTTNSTQNFRNFTTLKKLKTSAFTEGIQEITPDEAIKTATFSGWMAKKSTNNLGWKSRYFTLHGTRLLYFTSLKDRKEKGLIDITAHKVVPISSNGDAANANEKYLAMYAASAGFGRFCFKLVPPAPGFRKGLTFTEPKTHYFSVDTQEDMRGWIKALMTSTIDIDDSAPVISSCSTPTVSLGRAQELLEQAREENKARDMEPSLEEFSKQEEAFTRLGAPFNVSKKATSVSEENSSAVGYMEDNTPNQQEDTPKLSVDTRNVKRTPSQSQFGFSSPYLLASGMLSPKLANSGSSPSATPILNKHSFDAGIPEKSDSKFATLNPESESKKAKKKSPEKMLAYSNDGSGNHTFVIKQKK